MSHLDPLRAIVTHAMQRAAPEHKHCNRQYVKYTYSLKYYSRISSLIFHVVFLHVSPPKSSTPLLFCHSSFISSPFQNNHSAHAPLRFLTQRFSTTIPSFGFELLGIVLNFLLLQHEVLPGLLFS